MTILRDYQGFLAPNGLGITDPLPFRRTDWGSSGVSFYQVTDCASYPNGLVVQIFSFFPFGTWNPANGDGGQFFTPFPGAVDRWVIGGTQDSGTPMQYFVGPEYGGTGWIAIGLDAKWNEWTTVAGHTAIATGPDIQIPLGSQQMRYILAWVAVPFRINTKVFPITLACVVTEVYSKPNGPADQASSMERAYYAAGWGEVRWEAWRNDGRTPSADLDVRMPSVNWGAPAAGWTMVDGRTWTRIVNANSSGLAGTVRSVADFGWNPYP